MAAWLKLIGSAKAPITEVPFHGNYTAGHVGFRKANKPGIRAGDHLFLYAAGGSRRIFALAEAIKDPEPDPNYDPNQEGSCRWKVPVHYLINLPVASGILIDDIISGQRDLIQSLRQASHIKLLPEESDTAQRKLEAARGPEAVEPGRPPMAGPWLYPISSGADRSFTLADGESIPVTVDSYRTLLGNGRLVEDLYWHISQNWNNIQIGDDVFIYSGDEDLGIIGYATVGAVEQRADGWCILPHFDLARSRALLENPVPAALVRQWVPFPRKSVINLASFQERLRAHLPWTARDSMAPIPESGKPILRELLQHIAAGRVVPNHPETYPGYKEIHDALNLPRRAETYGDSLNVQGLADLAEWTLEEEHPAITGLVVDRESLMPGHGYFELFGRPQDDFDWWADQIAASLEYHWEQFLTSNAPPPTPDAVDLTEPPPERIPTTTYRILRDTELARRVKLIHDYECQICGHTIELPDNSRYAEAHHIRPLGQPHNGPDVIGNILCVCPNHHAELDYGALPINLGSLRQAAGHPIEHEYIDYHNRIIHHHGE